MDCVKVLHDSGHKWFNQFSNVFDYGIHMSDGKYLFVEGNNEYVAVELDNEEMLVEEFSSRFEALLWLLNFDMWRSIYRDGDISENEVKIINDNDYEHHSGLIQAFSDGVSMADGKYIYVEEILNTEEKLFVPVSFCDGKMSSIELKSKEEAMLWLLDLELWEGIYGEPEEVNNEE